MNTFRFILRDPDGATTFGADQVQNWDSIVLSMTRNKTYRGLLRKFTGTFEFADKIRRRIIRVMDLYGSNAELYLTVQVGNANKDQGSFRTIGGGEIKTDMGSIDVRELTVELAFNASDFEEVLFSRDNNKVEYATNTSVDGATLQPYTTKRALLHDRVLELRSELTIPAQEVRASFNSIGLHRILKTNIKYKSEDDFKITEKEPAANSWIVENCFILNADGEYIWDLSIRFGYTIQHLPDVHDDKTREVYLKIYEVDADSANIFSTKVEKYSKYLGLVNVVGVDLVGLVDETIQLSIAQGKSAIIAFDYPDTPNNMPYNIYLNVSDDTVLRFVRQSAYPATGANLIPPHELFERTCQIITGKRYPFYSELFGRKELGYINDGERAYLCAGNGLMIRDFPFAGSEPDTKYANISTSLRDIFKNYNALLNLAAVVEQMPNGNYRFRVEKYDTIFKQKNIISLGAFVSGVSRELDNDAIFGEVVIGCKDYQYEEVNGLEPFNCQFNYTTPLKSTGKLDALGSWRWDDYGIELARRNQYVDSPTADTRYDADIYIIDCKPSTVPGYDLEAVKAEDYDSVTGILSPDTVYNLNLSPGQTLRRWMSVINTSMIKGGVLKYGASEKNSNLITVKDGVEIVERADVTIDGVPLHMPEQIKIDDFPLTFEQYQAIESDPSGVCEIENKGVKLYGHIEELDYSVAKGTASIVIKRLNR
jgi:hypothetical protein